MSKRIFAIFLILIFVCSCVETVVVGTVAGGVIITKDNNKTETISNNNNTSKDEKETKKSIKKALKNDNGNAYRNVNIIIFDGRILLSGYVKYEKYKKSAVSITTASQPNNEIIDEIIVLHPTKKISGLNDYFISQNISIRLKKIKDIKKSDYKYNVINSVAIIIGKVQTKKQMEEITDTISTTRGVEKVISYIQF